MGTILQENPISVIETHCYAAEILWDVEMAEMFRQLSQDAVGNDCLCHEGESCSLMASALKGLEARGAAKA